MPHRSQIAVPEAFECDTAGSIASAGPRFSLFPPHRVEEEVTRTLRDTPGVYVQSLSVHRTGEGVCLHGVVEVDDPCTDIEAIVRRGLSIDQVVNRLLIKHGHSARCDDSDCSGHMW